MLLAAAAETDVQVVDGETVLVAGTGSAFRRLGSNVTGSDHLNDVIELILERCG
jgi:hypothetical protein